MYAIIDLETTGGKYNQEGITEVAIYKFDGLHVVDQLISLVNPETPIQPFVEKLTGISDSMVRTAPKFHELAKRIIEITEGCVLVAHNAQFDYRILKLCYDRLGYTYERKTVCTVDLAKKLIPDQASYSLGKLVKSLGIPIHDRHRASGDALATLKLFQVLLEKDLEKGLFHSMTKGPEQSLVSDKQWALVQQIPDTHGVIVLLSKDEKAVYLFSDKNMYKATYQLFLSGDDHHKRVLKETKNIEAFPSGNSLMTQILHHVYLKTLKPKYNRRKKLWNDPSLIEVYQGMHGVWIAQGRTLGERAGIYMKNGMVCGYAYFDLNFQLNNPQIFEQLLTPIFPDPAFLVWIEAERPHLKWHSFEP
ncbi:MAG: PolC-type DNA polymerase III [Flavobacteriaceae bacterium]